MWRSFFYAVGIGLFALGLEGLVFDHVLIPKDLKIQRFIKKIASDGPSQPNSGLGVAGPQSVAANGYNQQYPAQANQTSRFAGFDTGSRYGPSRFAGPAYGSGYGGGRVGSDQDSRLRINNLPSTRAGQCSIGGLSRESRQRDTCGESTRWRAANIHDSRVDAVEFAGQRSDHLSLHANNGPAQNSRVASVWFWGRVYTLREQI